LSLKEKTIHGLSWSLVNNLFTLGIQFIIGVILARLLSPEEFGLIGMTTIFTVIARTFVDSGFSTALIRKKTCTQAEYSTVFFYNFMAGILLYAILFVSAPQISNFFNEPRLINLIRVIGINILILAISQIQRAILIKRIDFKRLTVISAISMLISGGISITLAIRGFGVWSLVSLMLIRSVLESILYWVTSHWKPSIVFDLNAFKELFGFGSKMLLSSLLNAVYQNVYKLVIAKYFSVADLGLYTRASRISDLVGRNVDSIIQSLSFPVMASIGDDALRLRKNYKRLIMSSSLLSFFLSLVMVACARSLVISLLGSKWSASVPYLQLLCLSGMFYPLHSLNLNILKVKGRSDLFLKLEVIKKLLAVPTTIVGIKYGIIPMLYMLILSSIIAFFINTHYSGQLIGYSTFEQIRSITPSFLLSGIVALPVYLVVVIFHLPPLPELLVQISVTVIGAVIVGMHSRYEGVIEIKQVVISQVNRFRR